MWTLITQMISFVPSGQKSPAPWWGIRKTNNNLINENNENTYISKINLGNTQLTSMVVYGLHHYTDCCFLYLLEANFLFFFFFAVAFSLYLIMRKNMKYSIYFVLILKKKSKRFLIDILELAWVRYWWFFSLFYCISITFCNHWLSTLLPDIIYEESILFVMTFTSLDEAKGASTLGGYLW